MKKIILFSLLLIFNSCKAQNTGTIPNKKMEKFDIEKFNKNKAKSGSYFITLTDNTEIHQFEAEEGYIERITPENTLFQTEKFFHKNGYIKEKGEQYKNFFQKGIWYYYDKSGNLIKEIDHDIPYQKFSWEKIELFLKQKNIPIEQVINITRKNTTLGARWYITYIKNTTTQMGEIIIIDAENEPGKVISVREQSFKRYLD